MKFKHPIQLAFAIGALAAAPAVSSAQTGSTMGPPHQQGSQQGSHGQWQGAGRGQAQQGAGRGQAQGAQQQQAQRQRTENLREQVSFPVEDGCKYTASVNGKIQRQGSGKSQQPSSAQGMGGAGAQGQAGQGQPGGLGGMQGLGETAGGGAVAGQSGQAQGGAGAQAQAGQAGARVIPDLTITAAMSCPNAAEVRVTDTLKTQTPVTESELQDMISRRASVATSRTGRLCMYVPQFDLTENRLTGRGVTQLCQLSAQPSGEQQQPKQGMR